MPDKFMDREAASTAGLKYYIEAQARRRAEEENERARQAERETQRTGRGGGRKSSRR